MCVWGGAPSMVKSMKLTHEVVHSNTVRQSYMFMYVCMYVCVDGCIMIYVL